MHKMEMSTFTYPTTCVTFGVRVSLEMLGARLEAHEECKAALKALEPCVQDLPRLPQEVWDKIVNELQQSTYEGYLEWWKSANRCCKYLCECPERRPGISCDEHQQQVQELLEKIDHHPWDHPFSCNKVFNEEFGLELRFGVHWHRDYQERHVCTVHAYIVLPPIIESKVDFSGDGARKNAGSSILSSIFIDHIPEPNTEQVKLFEAALETLHLQPIQYKPEEIQKVNVCKRVEEPASSITGWPKLLVLTTGNFYQDY